MTILSNTVHKVNDYQAGLELTKDINEIITGLENVKLISTADGTTSYTVGENDLNIVQVVASADCTVTLPKLTATKTGKVFCFANVTSENMTLNYASGDSANGGFANGDTSLVLGADSDESVTVVKLSNTYGWLIKGVVDSAGIGAI